MHSRKITDPRKLLENSKRGIITFFLQRELDDGGFCSGRYLPATVEDTYHALRSLHALSRLKRLACLQTCPNWVFPGKVPVQIHIDFIEDRLQQEWNNAPRLFQLVCSLHILLQTAGTNHDLSGSLSYYQAKRFLRERVKSSGRKEELFYAVRICRILGLKPLPTLDISFHDTEYFVESVNELRMFLYLRRTLSGGLMLTDTERWKEWLLKCRNGDGGYGFFPGTTSYTENVYSALECYRLLDLRPRGMEKTTGFLRGCRSRTGGFGRRCQGIAFPDSTWHAAYSLIALAGVSDNA